MVSDLSHTFTPVGDIDQPSFEPFWLGDATGRSPRTRSTSIGFDQPVSLLHGALVGDLELNSAAQSRSILFAWQNFVNRFTVL